MCDKNLLLVKTIKKFPCLYNQHLSEYSRKDVTDMAWNEVANETKQTVSECKEKWKNLRYSFVRSLKPNSDGSSKKKYYLHDEMEYILPFIKLGTSKNLTESMATFLDYDSDEENIDSNQDMLSSMQEPHYAECIEVPHIISEPAKKKIKNSDTITANHFQSTYMPGRHDEDLRRMFLLSLLPEVTVLTEPQMRIFRRKVLKLLDDVSQRGNEATLQIWEPNTDVHRNDLVKNEHS